MASMEARRQMASMSAPARPSAPPGRQRVDLIEEDDTGRGLLGLLEPPPYPLLTLPHPLRNERWALHRYEVDAALVGHRLSKEGLPGAGGPVEEYALGGP